MGSLIYKPVLKLKLTKLNPHSKHKTSIKGKLCTVITSLKQAGYNINRCDVKLSLWGGWYKEGTLYVHKNYVYELNIGNSLLGIDDGNNCVNVNVTWMSGSEESRVVL